MMNRLLSTLLLCVLSFLANAQKEDPAWDDTKSKNWPAEFERVQIPSSADGSQQNAMFYASRAEEPKPLIVSLHTWSGDYLQKDPLTQEILLRDWNYIHPDFRGPNTRPDACGSELVLADLEDAIQYALQNGQVNPNEVHIIGVSGGGYATLLAYMKLQYPVKSFSAWAAISNLDNWYWECKGRGLKYAGHLEGVTTGGEGYKEAEAKKRSPFFMDYDSELRKNASLAIYAGIHDGYTGSVPISHSIAMFNKLAGDRNPEMPNASVSTDLAYSLVTKRMNPEADVNFKLGGRTVYLKRHLPGLTLTVFDGTHEMLVPQALPLIEEEMKDTVQQLNVLTIGDSNGTFPYSWPQQLKKLLPYSNVVNRSISGNTIGFDNNGREDLNTLKNIKRYLDESYAELGEGQEFDYLLINLGTNDTKKVFEKRQQEVYANFEKLIEQTRNYMTGNGKAEPQICWVSPSPMDEEKALQEKYGGGDRRVQRNNEKFARLSARHQISFINSYPVLKVGFESKTDDGVHLLEPAQFELASVIADWLRRQ